MTPNSDVSETATATTAESVTATVPVCESATPTVVTWESTTLTHPELVRVTTATVKASAAVAVKVALDADWTYADADNTLEAAIVTAPMAVPEIATTKDDEATNATPEEDSTPEPTVAVLLLDIETPDEEAIADANANDAEVDIVSDEGWNTVDTASRAPMALSAAAAG